MPPRALGERSSEKGCHSSSQMTISDAASMLVERNASSLERLALLQKKKGSQLSRNRERATEK